MSRVLIEETVKIPYTLVARNPVSGKVETYFTTIEDPDRTIPLALDFWENGAGYEIISFEPTENNECQP